MPKFTMVRPVQHVRHGISLFRSRRILGHMMREVIRGDYKLSFLTIVILVISIAYVVFPFDLIPDFIPVLGWIDDGLVLYLVLKRLVKETQRYNRYKAMERKNDIKNG